jgi:D-psicose/D-tagatose/L-ribulose 3-epimerase
MSGLRDQGFAALEIPMFNPSALDTSSISKALAANDLECSVCAILPEGINPISADPDTRKRSITHLQACIEATASMGSHLLAGPVYGPIGYQPGHRRTNDEWRWFLDALHSIEQHLETNDVTLAFEPVNRSETHFIRTASDALALCDAMNSPRIGVTIDTFHANIEEKNTTSALRSLGSNLKHIHLSENHRGIVGSGQIDFAAIHRALKAISYEGYLMIEGFGYSAAEPTAPGFLWAEQETTPESFAKASLTNVRELLRESGTS